MEYIPFLNKIDFERIYMRQNEMDFEGQKRAEKHYKIIIVIFAIIGTIFALVTQQMRNGVFTILTGMIISSLITIPSWPCYNRMGLKWQEHKPENKVDNLK